MEAAQKVVSAVRSLRSDYGLIKEKTTVSLTCADVNLAAGLSECAALIATLSTSSSVTLMQASPAIYIFAFICEATMIPPLLPSYAVSGFESGCVYL